MNDRRFGAIRRDHVLLRQALDRLDAATRRGPASSPRRRAALAAAVEAFLSGEKRLLDHMEAEEARVLALLDRDVPAEAGPAAVLREEHQTARALLALLRRDLGRLDAAGEDVTAGLAAAGQDLSSLLRAHIHREEEVLHPLLRRLQGGPRRV